MATRPIILRIVAILVVLALVAAFATQAMLRHFGLAERIDNGSPASGALFSKTGDLAAIYNRQPLQGDKPRVILIGASNFILIPAPHLQQTLRREPRYRDYVVNNMSVQGVSIPSFRRLVDLAYGEMPADEHGHTMFVLGIWYGFFSRPLDNDFERGLKELIEHYGLYRVAPDGQVVATHPKPFTDAALFLLKPAVLVERLFSTVSDFGKSLETFIASGSAGKLTVSDQRRNETKLTPQEKAEMIRSRIAGTEQIHPINFQLLQTMAETISGHGDRLLVVDLPMPAWHRNAVPAFARYEAAKRPWIERLERLPGVHFLDLVEALPDDDFYDSVHPKPLAAEQIADTLAGRIAESDRAPH